MIKAKPITFLARLPLCAAVLTPLAVSAQPGFLLQGSFSISAEAPPNRTGATFCGGSSTDAVSRRGTALGSHDTGRIHVYAAQDTPCQHRRIPGLRRVDGARRRYLGSQLRTYPGEQRFGNSASDFNGGRGSLTVTGGTGRFSGATGTLKMTGLFLSLYPANSLWRRIGAASGRGELYYRRNPFLRPPLTGLGPLTHICSLFGYQNAYSAAQDANTCVGARE
jgi:hypothetical protein